MVLPDVAPSAINHRVTQVSALNCIVELKENIKDKKIFSYNQSCAWDERIITRHESERCMLEEQTLTWKISWKLNSH